jgi:hypothetical protein
MRPGATSGLPARSRSDPHRGHPSHFREWWAEGAFFFALSLLEGALGAALLFTRARRPCLAAAVLSLATIAVWAWSRTTGLPLGPEAGYPEPVGRADTVATLLEALTALALAPAALRSGLGPHPPPRSRYRSTAAALVAVAVATAFGLAGADNHTHDSAHAAPTPINVAGASRAP